MLMIRKISRLFQKNVEYNALRRATMKLDIYTPTLNG